MKNEYFIAARVYFGGPFTFMVWIKLSTIGLANIINFGNGYVHNIAITTDFLDYITVSIKNGGGILSKTLRSWTPLPLEVWSHLAVVQSDDGETHIYFNGNLAGTGTPQNY